MTSAAAPPVIDIRKVCMAFAKPSGEPLPVLADIDIALDTFPYNGGTTTMEALWQGVPVLTFWGDRWASRISASLLREAGLGDYVTEDVEEYIARAIALAQDPSTPLRLQAWREQARERLGRSPACDVTAFSRHMESLLSELHAARNRSHPQVS